MRRGRHPGPARLHFWQRHLVHRDYGKTAFTFHRRSDGAGLRLVLRPDALADVDPEFAAVRQAANDGDAAAREKLPALSRQCAQRILAGDPENLFIRTAPQTAPPRRAAILSSLVCQDCGESVMESRTRRFAGQTLCIPCFNKVEQKI